MNDLKIFNNPEFGNIRAITLDGEPWLVGKDVAAALGYGTGKSLANAVANHVDPEDKGVTEMMTPGGIQNMTIINESGLYSLVLSSKLPTARRFKRWITSEVLPSIRRTGVYAAPSVDSSMMYRIAEAMREKEQQIGRLEAENELQRQALADAQPKAEYLDTILESTGTLATTQIAADYGLSAVKLNQILHEAGLQHNVNGQWIPYRKYMGKGLTKSKTIPIVRHDGRPDTKLTTQWTQKGRLLIHDILKERAIVPMMDLT